MLFLSWQLNKFARPGTGPFYVLTVLSAPSLFGAMLTGVLLGYKEYGHLALSLACMHWPIYTFLISWARYKFRAAALVGLFHGVSCISIFMAIFSLNAILGIIGQILIAATAFFCIIGYKSSLKPLADSVKSDAEENSVHR